ncbi:MAG: hypothetical protein IJZ13_03985, partial [Clostridia bacterium]|nr:hypothetical protein [Clostridia bacterium]
NKIGEALNGANGKFEFEKIDYAPAGNFTYTVKEDSSAALKGVTYDDTVYTVTVTVTDEGNGQLQAKVDGVGTAEAPTVKFVNQYVPKSVDVVLGIDGELSKALEGRELNADDFVFAVFNSENEEIATAKNNKNGTFAFTLHFTKAGTYSYTIAEKNNGVAGVTYDEKIYGVEINIVDKGGYLEADSVVYTLDGKAVEEIVFSNTYEAKDVDVTISATKDLMGRELTADEFIFAVFDSENEEIATAKNNKNGTFAFTLHFTKAGTYSYTIAEKNNGLAVVTYDEKIYGVEINIVDKGGYLEADSVVYTLDGKAVEEVVFSNTYEAEDTDITISAIKNLIGRDLNDGEFKFVLKDPDGKIIATATNTKDGKIVFDKIVLTEAGTYVYTVFEETGTLEHVIYDKTQYIVEVTVEDDGNGKLIASAPIIKKAGSNDAVTDIIFENAYTVPSSPDVPAIDNPQTGVNANLWLWFALLFVSGGGLIGTTIYGRKRRKTEN